jgi:hypothetical protein
MPFISGDAMTTIFIANLGYDQPKYAPFGLSDPFLVM